MWLATFSHKHQRSLPLRNSSAPKQGFNHFSDFGSFAVSPCVLRVIAADARHQVGYAKQHGETCTTACSTTTNHIGCVDQIRVDVAGSDFDRFALDLRVVENAFALSIKSSKTDDSNMHRRFAPRFRIPCKRAVGKMEVDAHIQQRLP